MFLLEDKIIFRHRPRAKRLVPDPGVGRGGDPKPRTKGREESKKRSVFLSFSTRGNKQRYALRDLTHFPRDPACREQRGTKPREIRSLLKSTIFCDRLGEPKIFLPKCEAYASVFFVAFPCVTTIARTGSCLHELNPRKPGAHFLMPDSPSPK